MSDAQETSRHEYGSTYFVQDRQSKREMERVAIQDHMLTTKMGGVLPEQSDPSTLQHVLDIGCGTGGWIIATAQAYPTISLCGIDISTPMIEYARQQAITHHVADRTEFHVMDALVLLEFPPGFFDLVNLRLGGSFLRTWEWPRILGEMLRVTRSDGIIRITDAEIIHQSSSPALLRFWGMMQCAFSRSGRLFTDEVTGISAHLTHLLTQHGCQQVQTRPHDLEYRAATAEGQAFFEDMVAAFHTLEPFLQKWGCYTQDYAAICQQACAEMQQPDFYAIWSLLTVWGRVP